MDGNPGSHQWNVAIRDFHKDFIKKHGSEGVKPIKFLSDFVTSFKDLLPQILQNIVPSEYCREKSKQQVLKNKNLIYKKCLFENFCVYMYMYEYICG